MGVLARFRLLLPGSLEQNERAGDVGLDEWRRIVNRSVDVRFGGKVDDRRRTALVKHRIHRRSVGDIRLNELNARILQRIVDAGQVSGVSQLIEIDYAI